MPNNEYVDSSWASTESPTVGLRQVVSAEIAPTDFAVAPGDSEQKYIADQPGRILVLEDGSIRNKPFLDIRSRTVDLYWGHDERGLVGLAFHPDFETNRRFFVRYSAPPNDETPEGWDHTEVLAEFTALENEPRADPSSEKRILEMPHPWFAHNAGQIAFGPDGYLYMAMGDGGGEGDQGRGHVDGGNGQDITETLMGAISRIDVDNQDGAKSYSIPDDNPLVARQGIDELYAWGFRNPFRISFDSEGRLFASDTGEHLYEWVNRVEKGGNYGWRLTEGSHGFDPESMWETPDERPTENDRGEPLLDPIVEYPHQTEEGELIGSAVIGGYVYEGEAIPALRGSYVFGDLSQRYDTPRGRLFAATPPDDKDDRWALVPIAIEGMDANLLEGYVFTLGRDHDGELYVLSSEHLDTRKHRQGSVYKLVPAEEGDVSGPEYGWYDATSDAYWHSLYTMNNTFVMSGNGIVFPFHEEQFDSLTEEIKAAMKGMMQRAKFMMRKRQILESTRHEELPVKNPHLNVAPFTHGDPHFLQEPDPPIRNRDHRPDASTMRWDHEHSSQVISPAAFGWTHLKGVTWAKSFEHEFNLAPIATRDRPQILGTAAQLGIKFALQNGNLRLNPDDEDDMRLVGTYRPATGDIVEQTAEPDDYAAMLWFLSDMLSFAANGWFGYENPSPLIELPELLRLADGIANATFEEYPPGEVLSVGTTRDLGVLLGATGWYGVQAVDDDMVRHAAAYANDLADAVVSNVDSDGRVSNGATNLAATHGIVGQGLLWASEIDGVDRTDTAEPVLDYLLDDLWDDDAGIFASEQGANEYRLTARDAGDITGGLNAADAVLEKEGVKEKFATYFDETFNRGRLQRATRWQAYHPERSNEYVIPLESDAGGEYGQAAVYNTAVEYDVGADEWRVTDDTFETASALYLSNQNLWMSIWGGEEFPGRGVPGESDRLPRWQDPEPRRYPKKKGKKG